MSIGMRDVSNSKESTINTKAVAKYALMPGILPRLGRLARHISEFMFIFTQFFGTIGLIDRNHPCMQPENIGAYRFTDILALAVGNLRWNRDGIPQIIMFSAVILSLLIIVAIVGLFFINVMLSAGVAQAQFFGDPPEGIHGYDRDQDWALLFLGRMFGTDMFAASAGGNMWFAALLAGMLKHYSLAMMIIAALMIMYLMVITLTEAARTGQPFGTRFDGIWAPIRMALAIGLLIPIVSPGYNGAQLLVFQSAKWGSNLASNAWFAGLSNIDKDNKFLSAAMADQGYRYVRDIFLVNLCIETLKAQSTQVSLSAKLKDIRYYLSSTDDFINISFGPYLAPDFCGSVKIAKVPEQEPAGLSTTAGSSWPTYTINQFQKAARQYLPIPLTEPLSPLVTVGGYGQDYSTQGAGALLAPMTQQMPLASMHNAISEVAKRMANSNNEKTFSEHMYDILGDTGGQTIYSWIQEYWSYMGRESYEGGFFTSGDYPPKLEAYNQWIMDQLKADAKYGWTTAGVFYLRMSAVMSNISNVVNNPPRVATFPSNLVKEYASPENSRADTDRMRKTCKNIWSEWFGFNKTMCARLDLSENVNNILKGGNEWFLNEPKKTDAIYSMLGTDAYDQALEISDDSAPSNPSLGRILGPVIGSLYSLAEIDSGNLHPLGTVINWGFLMMQTALFALALSFVPGTIGSIAMTIGTVLLIPGFILAFWIPMQPFMYFTFAVIEWMISVLEAVIGMPLWALSLITLEGDGLGKGMNGVKRIFEIILRPTIIIMSLLVSVIVFSAGVSFFNDALRLYTTAYAEGPGSEVSIFSRAGASIGMIFVYMFAIYSLATSCFKLIDAIPDAFGRWGDLPAGFGSGIKTGMNQLAGFVMGGMMLNNAIGAIKQGRSNVIANKKAEVAAKKGAAKDAALETRLSTIEKKLP